MCGGQRRTAQQCDCEDAQGQQTGCGQDEECKGPGAGTSWALVPGGSGAQQCEEREAEEGGSRLGGQVVRSHSKGPFAFGLRGNMGS